MQTMRVGRVPEAVAAARRRGRSESRRGSARLTPAARRKNRRSTRDGFTDTWTSAPQPMCDPATQCQLRLYRKTASPTVELLSRQGVKVRLPLLLKILPDPFVSFSSAD